MRQIGVKLNNVLGLLLDVPALKLLRFEKWLARMGERSASRLT